MTSRGTASGGARVTVVGSINRDVVLRVPRLPRPGETVAGADALETVGGKGANQAVAAARLGATVAFVGAVGPDGDALLRVLTQQGVDVGASRTLGEGSSGVAVVLVDDDGENVVAVSPGSNARLTPDAVPQDLGAVVLLQQEVPPDVVLCAARRARGSIVILNPAPFRPIEPDLLDAVDILVPNGSELAQLVGGPVPHDVASATALLRELRPSPLTVVATLGALGALVRRDGVISHVPAPMVDVVDTVGAGDTLCGGLAAALAAGVPLLDAVRFGVHAGSLAVGAAGAQGAMPDRQQVLDLLRRDGHDVNRMPVAPTTSTTTVRGHALT